MPTPEIFSATIPDMTDADRASLRAAIEDLSAVSKGAAPQLIHAAAEIEMGEFHPNQIKIIDNTVSMRMAAENGSMIGALAIRFMLMDRMREDIVTFNAIDPASMSVNMLCVSREGISLYDDKTFHESMKSGIIAEREQEDSMEMCP